MVDNDTDDDHDGFVFENDSPTTRDGTETGRSERRVGVLVVAAVIVVVLLGAIAGPFVTNTLTHPFGGGSGAASDPPIGTAGTNDTPATAVLDRTTTNEPATTRPATAPQPPLPRTSSVRTTATTAATRTPTATIRGDGGNESGETPTANGTTDDRSPTVEAFTVTDRSGGGGATFDVAWTVTDPDSTLDSIEVRLVADPGGNASTLERRRFDAGGRRATGNATFAVPDGGGAVYEIGIEATDNTGNTAFELVREVADGTPDESIRRADRTTDRPSTDGAGGR